MRVEGHVRLPDIFQCPSYHVPLSLATNTKVYEYEQQFQVDLDQGSKSNSKESMKLDEIVL